MNGFKITFENGSIIWVAASGIIKDFQPVPFGQPLEKNDIVMEPEKVCVGDIVEYLDYRRGRIRDFSSVVKEVEVLEGV